MSRVNIDRCREIDDERRNDEYWEGRPEESDFDQMADDAYDAYVQEQLDSES